MTDWVCCFWLAVRSLERANRQRYLQNCCCCLFESTVSAIAKIPEKPKQTMSEQLETLEEKKKTIWYLRSKAAIGYISPSSKVFPKKNIQNKVFPPKKKSFKQKLRQSSWNFSNCVASVWPLDSMARNLRQHPICENYLSNRWPVVFWEESNENCHL